MKLTLDNELLSILFDTKGGFIDRLTYKEEDVFFKRDKLDYNGTLKSRGGCHVCLPQFGSGGEFDLPSHGFGREVDWVVLDISRGRILLEAMIPCGKYEKLGARLEYEIIENRFISTLVVINNGDEDLPIAPGFHPYFNLADEDFVILDGEKLDVKDPKYKETDYIENPKILELNGFKIEMDNMNLPVHALWTDLKGRYFCIEPTYNSTCFEKGEGFYILAAKEEMAFSYELKISKEYPHH